MKLLDEIKNDTVKIDKHKKIVKDAKSKLEFLSVISEYIILFLDNERMNTMGGLEEHQKSMNEACSNLQKDLIEIQNMYSLLIKEMTGKSSKKAYKELYNLEYLLELQQNEKEFAESISKINMIGTVVYPDYWRVEGMQKMYDTFKHILTEVYEKDLSEYEPLDITFSVNEEVLNTEDNTETADEGNAENTNKQEDENGSDKEGNTVEKNKEDEKDGLEEDLNVAEDNDDEEFHWDDDDEDDELIFENNSYILREDEKEDSEEDDDNSVEEKGKQQEIDKEIDEILGFFDSDDAIEDEEDDDETPLELEEDDLEEKIFEDKYEEEVEEQDDKEDKKKRKGLFARRNK